MAKPHVLRSPDGSTQAVDLTASLAIKAMCTECFGFEGNPKKECTSKFCPLFPFRGRTTIHSGKREMTEEQKAQAAERLREARKARKA